MGIEGISTDAPVNEDFLEDGVEVYKPVLAEDLGENTYIPNNDFEASDG